MGSNGVHAEEDETGVRVVLALAGLAPNAQLRTEGDIPSDPEGSEQHCHNNGTELLHYTPFRKKSKNYCGLFSARAELAQTAASLTPEQKAMDSWTGMQCRCSAIVFAIDDLAGAFLGKRCTGRDTHTHKHPP